MLDIITPILQRSGLSGIARTSAQGSLTPEAACFSLLLQRKAWGTSTGDHSLIIRSALPEHSSTGMGAGTRWALGRAFGGAE